MGNSNADHVPDGMLFRTDVCRHDVWPVSGSAYGFSTTDKAYYRTVELARRSVLADDENGSAGVS